MKKNIIIAVLAVAAMAVSCKKDRTCTCESTSTVVSTSNGQTTTTTSTDKDKTTVNKIKKGDMKWQSDCHNKTETYTSSFGQGQFAVTNNHTDVYKCTLD